MGKKQSLPDWLPAGWKMDARTRMSGKKDKCYTEPSNKFKFYSKADVLRHISEEMKKNGSGKFAVEKAVAEGLPPGWTKEIRVKKKGGKTRRDPYYIDPESGQVFRSLREVSRYLETKDCSKSAPELKAQGPNNVEAGGSLSSLPSETEEQKVGESKADKQIAVNERLELVKEQILEPNGTECSTSPPGNTSPQCREGAVKENNYVLQVNNLEGDKDSGSRECPLVSANEAIEKEKVVLPSGKEVEKHVHKVIQKKRKKSRNKKVGSLPRRTSKRLAGIEADVSLEVKSDNQGSPAAARQKDQTKAVVNDNSSNLNKEIKTGNAANEKKQEATTSALGKLQLHPPDGNGREVGPYIKDDEEKSGMTPESSSVKDMWMDPCIEFAIKTLTGTIPVGDENKVDDTPQSSLSSSAGNQQSSVDLPLGDIWSDPCFAFAVKTLTGEIPIADDLSGHKVLEQQCSSARPQISNGLAQPSPLYKQQGPVAPPAYQNCWLSKFGSNRPSSLC